MTFQEILEGITRHRAQVLDFKFPSGDMISPEFARKINEIEWALQALAEALRDHEKQFESVGSHERAGHGSDAREEDFNEVDEAFDEYEKRK